MTKSLAGGAAAAPLSMRAAESVTSAAIRAARQLLTDLERGHRIDATVLRTAMEAAFGASDADGAWNWKTAYDVCGAAIVLFLPKFGPGMRARAGSTTAMLPVLAKIEGCLPTHTRRSQESEAFQQFSTPIILAFAASVAASISPADTVLEPSAGTGLLAILAELSGGSLVLNELAEARAGLLGQLLPTIGVTSFDAAQIDDHLGTAIVPSVVLMNPPFSAIASALGQESLLVTPLSRFRQGTPIRLAEGILFTTYATLRSDARDEKVSRVSQIVEWLSREFDGVIIFDESHAMQNAAGGKGERGDAAASQQGRAGLRLQHGLPNARVVYVSATGATTVHNLGYAQRLGLWGGKDFPFATRAEFVDAIKAGGVAAMEVLARDLKALRPYAARSLSYEGVEYELVEHTLTEEQIGIYDAYAVAFGIIQNNLEATMRAANFTGSAGTLNAQAKSAAHSAFESAKQRFFNHLITAMKTPSLIASFERDLVASHAAVIQIVSTGEALMEQRLAEIPTEECGDVQVDITPREYVLDYFAHSFPTQLYDPFADGERNLSSRPAYHDGQAVQCRDAIAHRDRLVEKLASLPPVHGPLDQIVQCFGTDMVAEVTGRSRRIVCKRGADRVDRLVVDRAAA